ncbi:hypothetical protein [uncultured Propionibacterium sp.]|uniref:hypothetical protein n=1 Tax=uncultured Propionibacterium sp. TaxID=218066 RepID=UPI00292E37BC|nr:hypothetical protein [uncultured Propionibacterium sp.]
MSASDSYRAPGSGGDSYGPSDRPGYRAMDDAGGPAPAAQEPGGWDTGRLPPGTLLGVRLGGDAPAVGAGSGTDPVEAARRALATVTLDEEGILLDPDPRLNEWGATAVGFHTWFHAPRPQPRHVRASQDGLAVDLAATPGGLLVDTGDGHSQHCRRTAPYQGPAGRNTPSPYCGHAWQHPGRYTVTATRTWTVTWTAGGRAGTETVTRPAGTAQVTVIDLTSVLTDPDR